MKLSFIIVACWATILRDAVVAQEHSQVKNEILKKVRQGTLREYLPPSNTQKPRPFEPVSPEYNGYPPAGITPQPPFPLYTNPTTGAVTGEGYPSPTNEITPPERPGFPTIPQPGYSTTQPPFNGYPTKRPPPFTGFPTAPPTNGYTPGYPTAPTQRPGFPTAPPTNGYTPGYPTGSTQRPGFPTAPPTNGYTPGYPTPSTQRPGFPTAPPTGYTSGYSTTSSQRPGFPTAPPTQYTPSERPGFPTAPPTGYTYNTPTQRPGFSTAPPTGYTYNTPTQRPGFPTAPPTYTTGFPTQPPTGYPTGRPSYPTQPPTDYTTRRPEYSTQPPVTYPTQYPSESPTNLPPLTSRPGTAIPGTNPPQYTSPTITTTPGSIDIQTTTDDNTLFPETTPGPETTQQPRTPPDDDGNHPPHIHAIDVQCAKDMMTIDMEFNREFNGVIYSKGYYNTPECRYVNENSEQTKYKFTVSLNSCGTEFVNAFDTQGQSYLENVLVLQNEPGIQEVWDTIRAVRCLWEGNLKESLSVALSVGMLSQELVTFSGDTAVAKLDIQLGRGPFAPAANGLVKIGEPMTLVVSVSGDPGFDIQVKDCRATDASGDNIVPLTDDNGCVLKPKLFGAFQKTRNTGDSGASIIAYAFFNAFKFPDVMDLMIECNIELCKTDCQVCPEANQKLEPGRRRKRDVHYYNETLGEGVTMGKHLRVILPEDLNDGKTILELQEDESICMSTQSFVFTSAIMVILLSASTLFSTYLWLKNQNASYKK